MCSRYIIPGYALKSKKRASYFFDARYAFIFNKLSGESGIRTHGDISATLDFESSALDQLSHLSERCGSGRAEGIMPREGGFVKLFCAIRYRPGWEGGVFLRGVRHGGAIFCCAYQGCRRWISGASTAA